MQPTTIVELDDHAANPGDLSWEPWRNIVDASGRPCRFVQYPRTPPELVIERAKEADIVLVNKVRLSAEVLAQLPRLRYIGILATGYNVVDVQAAHDRGIIVTNIPAYSTETVAQFTFALLLHVCNGVAAHNDAVQRGEWQRCPDFTFSVMPQMELCGHTFGIVGYGNIGRRVAEIAHAFGMHVLLAPSLTGRARAELPPYIIEAPTWHDFLAQADVVSLHCPLTPATKRMIDADALARMRPGAILLNTARGPLIDEPALAQALLEGRIRAAAVDVLRHEPPADGSPLIGCPNCTVTPHIAWAARAARARLLDIALDNVRAFLDNKPINTILP